MSFHSWHLLFAFQILMSERDTVPRVLVNTLVWGHSVPSFICWSTELPCLDCKVCACVRARVRVCVSQRYCIFNQRKRPGIILITLVSPGIYSYLSPCVPCGEGFGWVESIHLKFAHLTVVRDMDSDTSQLAQSPPLSSLIWVRDFYLSRCLPLCLPF